MLEESDSEKLARWAAGTITSNTEHCSYKLHTLSTPDLLETLVVFILAFRLTINDLKVPLDYLKAKS